MTSLDFQRSQALQPANRLLKTSTKFACAFIFLVLSACSGQDAATSASSTSSTSQTVAQQTSKELAQNPAVLTLTAPAPNSVLSSQIQAQSSIQPQATTANFSPVTRIQNTTLSGSYFFTIYNSERISALVANPRWNEEGTAFWASAVPDTGLSPVYRFRNNFNGSYLYTIYESEKADIVARYSATFFYEGPAWYASQTQLAGWTPLYRFRNKTNGTYLFTANEVEKNNIVASYASTFELEGTAYYVWQSTAVQPAVNVVCGISNFNAELQAFVNAYRAKGQVCNGVAYPVAGALAWNSQLEQAALVHSTDMADNNFFAHISATNGSTVGPRVTAAGYNYRSVGENIAAGYTSISSVMSGWMASSAGHCENIMTASHRDIGVSCKINQASDYKTYWTMELGAR
jgi:uncharacterized protein YkwD